MQGWENPPPQQSNNGGQMNGGKEFFNLIVFLPLTDEISSL